VQSTLLGLAIAMILALVAALVAPLVVDWNRYRTAFEAEAGRVTGLPVRVNGSIDARILPSPRVALRDVEVGAGAGARQTLVRAGTIELELGLSQLLRGVVQASEVRIVAPQINISLDRAGVVEWPGLTASARPDFTISRLTVENGRVTFADARSGTRVMLQKLYFSGDVRALPGPFRGEGAFVVGDTLYGYRLSGSRADETGAIKLRIGLDPTDAPTTDIEGTLGFPGGTPQFDGKLTLTRPVGATLAGGQTVISEPWHLTGKIKADPAAASLQEMAFQYGPDERPIIVNGNATITFGEHPRLKGAMSAQQLDVDRALAAPDVTHRPALVMMMNFVEAFVATVKPPIPADFAVSIDALTVGGTAIQALTGGVRYEARGWSLDGFKLHAPGLTDVKISGRLTKTPQGLAFSGPADLQSGDLKTLMAWLAGSGAAPSGSAEALNAHGDVTISSGRFAFDHLAMALNQEKMEGRLAYAWAAKDGATGKEHPASLEGELHAAQLDVDALTAFAKAATSGGSFEVPREVALTLDFGQATFAGIEARTVDARVKFNAGVLQVDRLSVADFGGAKLDISGHIDELSSRPRGRLNLDLDAATLSGLVKLLGKFAPQAAGSSYQRFANRLAPAKLHGTLTVDRGANAGAVAKLDLGGQVGALHLSLNGEAKGEPDRLGEAVVRLDSRFDGVDGTALMRLLGLDGALAVDLLPGQMTIAANGPLDGDLHVKALATAGGFAGVSEGSLRLTGDTAPTGTFDVKASAADLRPLHRAMTGQPGTAVPITASAKLAVTGGALAFTDLAVSVAKASLHGRLALDLATPIGIDGSLMGEDIDAGALAAMLLGLPSAAASPINTSPVNTSAAKIWSAEPIGAGAFGAVSGAIAFAFDRADFTSGWVVRDFKGIARFEPSLIVLDDLSGSLAGGRLTGAFTFRHDGDELAAKGHVELTGADAGAAFASEPKWVDGRLTLKLAGDSIGRSPEALIGALHGGGTVALTDAHVAGIDAAAFDVAMLAADQSDTIEPAKIRTVVSAAMEKGRLAVPQGAADVTVTAGQFRLANVNLQAQGGGHLGLAGVFNLNTGAVDARLTLSRPPAANALISAPPELAVTVTGPFAAQKRTLDVTELVNWLTLRAAEFQTRRLESIEANRRSDVLGAALRPPSPPIRFISPGTAAESASSTGDGTLPGSRGFERLRPEPPPPPAPIDPDRAPAAPPTAGAKPLPPHADNAATATGSGETNRKRPTPPQTAPAHRGPWDFLFRSQN
jgi:large subunit ribosomal protein L24